MAVEDVGETIMFVAYLSLVVAGINIIWGMFFYPWGIIGFAFAGVNVAMFFMATRAKEVYGARDYERARSSMFILSLLGFTCGLVVVGVFAYQIYRVLDDIVDRKYLVKAKRSDFYAPPQFPNNKK